MSESILVAVAWPYANADIHMGNIAGANLPADVFARYHRLKGNQVLMVSGTDAHGTPITVRAEAEKTSNEAIYERYHKRFLELFVRLGLSYDLFTTTHTENHFKVAQDIFLILKENGFLITKTENQWFSTKDNRFLPDRMIEGECYLCHYSNARGDQCDKCGNLLDATKLINPRAKTSGGSLELRATEHFYLDLSKLTPELSKFLQNGKDHWRPNVLNVSKSMVDSGELRPRAITRDLEWGIPVPVEGWKGKCLYVWFEAVIGYLSASIEWSKLTGKPDAWKSWWYEPTAKTFYFLGKDNIPFHSVIWPAELLGIKRIYENSTAKQLNLPYDVPANEFLNLEGQKISGSRNWAVWGLDALDRYDPDPIRYYLIANMPESKDSDWSWSEFVAKNNNELVATWGNLANRILTFAYKNFEGKVPDPGELRPEDNTIIQTIDAGFAAVGSLIEAVKLRAALAEAMRLASEVNRYIDSRAPWSEFKKDKAAAAKTVYTAIRVIDSLSIIFAPFIPFSSAKLRESLGSAGAIFGSQELRAEKESGATHEILTYTGKVGTNYWTPSTLKALQPLNQPAPLFKKLEPKVAEEELAKLKGQ